MKNMSIFQTNNNVITRNIKQKIEVLKDDDLVKAGGEKIELLGKYQIIFDILKQMR